MLFSATALLALLPAVLASPVLDKRAPLLQARDNAIAGKYIVKLKDGASDAALEKAVSKHKADLVFNDGGFKGFAGTLDADALEAIRNSSDVCTT